MNHFRSSNNHSLMNFELKRGIFMYIKRKKNQIGSLKKMHFVREKIKFSYLCHSLSTI
jgi:hypothetical protein